MRHINRAGGGYHLTQANSRPPQNSQQAASRWASFRHKQLVLDSLLDDQYQLCCYSELRADQYDLGYHIEHVENKAQAPTYTFEYANLAASALASHRFSVLRAQQQSAALPEDFFGGHAPGKQTNVDMQRFVSPLQRDCACFFAYLSDGRVIPANALDERDRDRAQYTIDLLNLNSPFLQVRRRQWWDELDTLIDEHLDKQWDLHCLASVDLVPEAHRISPFFSLTRYLFGRIAEEVLQQDAPHLL